MARLKLITLEPASHVAWQEGEILTVRITAAEGDGYECESLETFPADLKQQHAELVAHHLGVIEDLTGRLAKAESGD